MSLKRNFSVGLFSSIWSALIGLAVVPLYLKFLGTESYGLIGFFATMQAFLQLLDMGLSPTINREVARCSASGNLQEAKELLHTVAVVYWTIAGVIALIVLALAPVIAEHWLQSKHLPTETIEKAVMLMGMVVACRWPVGLYMGALMGLQRVALSSIIGTIFATLTSLGAVAVLAFISPTIKAFFIWQACVGIIFAIIIRMVAWRVLGSKNESRRFSFANLKRIWRFSAGISGVAITGAILIQLDKVLLSKLLNLEDFGRYMLAATISNGLYIILTPLFNAVYPRMTALIASGNIDKLTDLYKMGTRLFLAALFPIAITAAVFSKDLLFLWTRNKELAESSSLIVSFFLIGTTLNGVMHFPFALQLAYGETRLPFKINLILIAIMVPMTITLAKTFGAVGGAGSWALLNFIYVFIGTWLTHRVLLKGIGSQWLMGDVMLPFVIASIIGAFGLLIQGAKLPIYVDLIACVALVFVTFAIIVVISPRLRAMMQNARANGLTGLSFF